MVPFLGLFRQTSQLLLASAPSPNLPVVAQAMVLLIDVFYDLTCQDLPPAIEDNYNEFFGKDVGLFFRFLAWDPVELKSDVRLLYIIRRFAFVYSCPLSQRILLLPSHPK